MNSEWILRDLCALCVSCSCGKTTSKRRGRKDREEYCSSFIAHDSSFGFSPSFLNQAQVSRSQPSSKSLSWSATKLQAGIILIAADHLEVQVVLPLDRQLG